MLPNRLGILAATGMLGCLPGVAQAGPSATLADCLRPPQALSTASSSVLIPPGSGAPQLLAQALPAAGTNPSSTPERSSRPRDNNPQLAQAVVGPESLPACTYDPPLPPAPQIIRGLW